VNEWMDGKRKGEEKAKKENLKWIASKEAEKM
jgi:hypothetical protein